MDETKPFRWNNRRALAAQLLAEDELSDEEIAARIGISRRMLANWKLHPEFAARVRSIVETTRKAILARGIADQSRRVEALNDRWRRMKRVIEERGADPLLEGVPGGRTGLIVPEPMLVKVYEVETPLETEGEAAAEVEEGERLRPVKASEMAFKYAVDTGLLKAMLDLEKQAAQETGQWEERQRHSDPISEMVAATLDELMESYELANGGEGDPQSGGA